MTLKWDGVPTQNKVFRQKFTTPVPSGKKLRPEPFMPKLGPNPKSGRTSQLRAGGKRADKVLRNFD